MKIPAFVKNPRFFAIVLLGLASTLTANTAHAADVARNSFNADWRFHKGDPAGLGDKLDYSKIKAWYELSGNQFLKNPKPVKRPAANLAGDVSFLQPTFDDSQWQAVTLPHDWAIEGPFIKDAPNETGKLPFPGSGWYRKHFNIPATDKGQQINLDIEGAMAYAAVWLNGKFIGGWPYGYTSFRLDLTPYINFGGKNVIAIRLHNPPNSSRWYPGSGIYRNVWLVKTPPVHVAHWGTVVTTPQISSASASVVIDTTVENDSRASARISIAQQIYAAGDHGQPIQPLIASTPTHQAVINAGAKSSIKLNTTIPHPKLWNTKTPNLYVVLTNIIQGGKIIDRYTTTFGVRTIKFDANRGFLLNGKHVKIQGVCDHHDLGPLGAAFNTRAMQRKIQLLKEMGCNAIRTSHNMPAPELLDLCDRMGMLVMDESFDCWDKAKKPNDYHLLFKDWHEKDLRAEVLRDRNHPSIIIWSIGNEIPGFSSPSGLNTARSLTAIIHSEDTTRYVSAGANKEASGFSPMVNILGVFGYNYKWWAYKKFHQKNPNIPIYGSETASCVSSRGEYFFPVNYDPKDKGKGIKGFQVSSYNYSAPGWASPPDWEFKAEDENPFVAGEFVWTGFDYLGEPTPFMNGNALPRSSYFGILDLAGFKKSRFYIYQAHWNPDFAMARIFPHWNWPKRVGKVTPVEAYTSGDEAELFLNGKSLGRKKKGKLEYRLTWKNVKYEPGTLHVVAYKNGLKWAEDTVKTTGPASALSAKPDRATIHNDGYDLSYVTVAVKDNADATVPTAENPIHFSISGPGEIVATANGDPTCLIAFPSHDRPVFNGLALVIVRAKTGQSGKITLTAQSNGLKTATTTITAAP